MSSIYDISGTSSDSFSLNGKCTLLQGDEAPQAYQGLDGDVYFQSNGTIYAKRNGTWLNLTSASLPDANTGNNQFVITNGENYELYDLPVTNIAFKSTENTFTNNNTFSQNINVNGNLTTSGTLTSSNQFILNGYLKGQDISNQTVNANTLWIKINNGFKIYYTSSDGATANISNLPNKSSTFLESRTVRYMNDTDYFVNQICYQRNMVYQRTCTSGTWTGWFRIDGSNLVHKTGDETINGTKTFLARQAYIAPNIDTNVIPSSNVYNDFMVSMDKTANNQIGYFGNSQDTYGNIFSRMGASRRKQDGSYQHEDISVGIKTDGTVFTKVPTPALSSNSQDIVNTSWFNNKIKVVSTLPSSPDANVFYFVTNA